MIYLTLYLSFLKIGLTSFGGLSMIPLISREMTAYNFMTMTEITDIIAIAESTPGPLGINCATFAGVKAGGLLGGVIASLGVLTPSLTIGIVVSIFFFRIKDAMVMQRILTGIRPACIALICFTLFTLLPSTYYVAESIRPGTIFITLLIAAAMYKWKLSVPKCIALAAVLGLFLIR